MSTEYKAYFRLKNQTVEINKLQAFLTEYQFQYEDRPSYVVRNEDGFLREKLHDHYADWSQFVREVKELDFSPNAAIVHDSFYFALGFVKLDHETFSVFDISEGNLEDLSEFMKERNSNVLPLKTIILAINMLI
jgi:phenylalanine-4-hydroxylase